METEKQAKLIPLLMGCLENRPVNHQEGWGAPILLISLFSLAERKKIKQLLLNWSKYKLIKLVIKHIWVSTEVCFISLADVRCDTSEVTMGQAHE